MAPIYKYSVVIAVPDARRGERVNVGAVVFRPDREAPVDIRMPGTGKLRSLSAGAWNSRVTIFCERITKEYFADEDPKVFVGRLADTESVFRLSEPGWFIADGADDYERHVDGILSDLVVPPIESATDEELERQRPSRINSEIASEFKKIRILASQREGIEEGRVKRDHYVSVAKNIKADFVAKNGVYHVTSTLDLRSRHVHIKEAGWKAFVLVEALLSFGKDTKCFGVYAATDPAQFDPHLEILKAHTEGRVYNWLNPEEHWLYRQAMIAAVQRHGDILSSS